MRLLILADVHGNIDALAAIPESCDQVIFLGDAVDYGPAPSECIAWLRDRAHIALKGNHDAAVAEGFRCGGYRGISLALRTWTRETLNEADRNYLRWLPLTESFHIGGARFHLVHAAPSEPLAKYLLPSTPDEEWRAELAGLDADFVLLGHSHLPLLRVFGCTAVVNPGSVGQPRDGDPRAGYAVWDDGRVTLHRIEYDVEAAAKRLEALPLDAEVTEAMAAILRAGG